MRSQQSLIGPVVLAFHIVDKGFVGYFIIDWDWVVTGKIPVAKVFRATVAQIVEGVDKPGKLP